MCYGDSNTWGNIAGTFDQKLLIHQRYPYEDRWTGQLQHLLGRDYQIIEAGLNGRTTGLDDPNKTRSSRNGLTTLTSVLEMNYPIDLVILMLGTNDLKKYFHTTAEEITESGNCQRSFSTSTLSSQRPWGDYRPLSCERS